MGRPKKKIDLPHTRDKRDRFASEIHQKKFKKELWNETAESVLLEVFDIYPPTGIHRNLNVLSISEHLKKSLQNENYDSQQVWGYLKTLWTLDSRYGEEYDLLELQKQSHEFELELDSEMLELVEDIEQNRSQ